MSVLWCGVWCVDRDFCFPIVLYTPPQTFTGSAFRIRIRSLFSLLPHISRMLPACRSCTYTRRPVGQNLHRWQRSSGQSPRCLSSALTSPMPPRSIASESGSTSTRHSGLDFLFVVRVPRHFRRHSDVCWLVSVLRVPTCVGTDITLLYAVQAC